MCVFFNDTATTEIYTLSLHDALPICLGFRVRPRTAFQRHVSRILPPAGHRTRDDALPAEPARPRTPAAVLPWRRRGLLRPRTRQDRKSTRLNSSHANISYAVFCLKKK